jgi:putative transposase
MKLEVTVSEAKELIKQIQEQPEQLFEMIRTDVKQSVGHYLSELMNVELSEFLGRKPYERLEGLKNYRNGTYKRKYTLKGIGEVSSRIPRDRNGEFKTQVLPRSKQYEDIIRKDLSIMFLSGVSTRTLSMLSSRLIGRKISHTEVSNAGKELVGAVEKWRMRDLSKEAIKYIFVDGVNFSMRVENSIETVISLAM